MHCVVVSQCKLWTFLRQERKQDLVSMIGKRCAAVTHRVCMFCHAQGSTGVTSRGNAAHRAGEVYECMHLHEVILDGCAGDDDWQPYWDLPQALRQLRARVLDLVPLHKSSIRHSL